MIPPAENMHFQVPQSRPLPVLCATASDHTTFPASTSMPLRPKYYYTVNPLEVVGPRQGRPLHWYTPACHWHGHAVDVGKMQVLAGGAGPVLWLGSGRGRHSCFAPTADTCIRHSTAVFLRNAAYHPRGHRVLCVAAAR